MPPIVTRYGITSDFVAPDPHGDRQLRLAPVDVSAIPSYVLAGRAFAIAIYGVLGLCAAATIGAFVIPLTFTVGGAGALEPGRIWAVRPQEAGLLLYNVETGDTVRRGEVIARLDTVTRGAETHALSLRLRQAQFAYDKAVQALPYDILQARENIIVAENTLIKSRAQLKLRAVEHLRTDNVDSLLSAHRPGSSINVDQAVAEVRAAESTLRLRQMGLQRLRLDSIDLRRQRVEIASAESDLTRSRVHSGRLSIVAPADGIVLTDQLERRNGAMVLAGDQILELAEIRQWDAVAYLSDRDVHQVRPGQLATIEVPGLDTLSGRQLSAHVTAVASEPQIVQGTQQMAGGLYRVTLRVDQQEVDALPENLFRRGYTARVRIVTRKGTAAKLIRTKLREQISRFR